MPSRRRAWHLLASAVVIDACSLLNLLATGREVEIVRALDWQLISSAQARQQVRYLQSLPDAEGIRTRLPVDLEPLVSAGRLVTYPLDDRWGNRSDALGESALAADAKLRLEGRWLDRLIEFAEHLDDADASCVALAVSLQMPLVSDDAKVVRIAGTASPPPPKLFSTLSFLKMAVATLALTQTEQAVIAQGLRWRANFLPPKADPLRDWYARLLSIPMT